MPILLARERAGSKLTPDELRKMAGSTKTIKVEIRRILIQGTYKQIFVLNDISKIVKSEKTKMKTNFSQQLTASLCHEVMTPLNCIVNVADILLAEVSAAITLNSISLAIREANQRKIYVRTMHSSAKFMSYMLSS